MCMACYFGRLMPVRKALVAQGVRTQWQKQDGRGVGSMQTERENSTANALLEGLRSTVKSKHQRSGVAGVPSSSCQITPATIMHWAI